MKDYRLSEIRQICEDLFYSDNKGEVPRHHCYDCPIYHSRHDGRICAGSAPTTWKIEKHCVVPTYTQEIRKLEEECETFYTKEPSRKEIAKDILQTLYNHTFELVDPYSDDEECFGSIERDDLIYMAEKYGVEIEK